MNTAFARADGGEWENPPAFQNLQVTTGEADEATRESGTDETTMVLWLIGLRDDIEAADVKLNVPLRVTLSRDPDDGTHLAFAPFVRCCGTGSDYLSALHDLASEILSLRDELTLSQAELADDAREMKRRLLDLIP